MKYTADSLKSPYNVFLSGNEYCKRKLPRLTSNQMTTAQHLTNGRDISDLDGFWSSLHCISSTLKITTRPRSNY